MEGQFRVGGFEGEATGGGGFSAGRVPGAVRAIGAVFEIAGASSQVLLDLAELDALARSDDAALANAGQVGAQVKIRVGNAWLIASIRTARLDPSTASAAASPAIRLPGPRYSRSPLPISARSTPPTIARISRSAPSTRPGTSAPRSMSMRCSESISRCSARPVLASRPPPR
jgi:hypothetical protein